MGQNQKSETVDQLNIIAACLLILTTIALTVTIKYLQIVLVPFVLSIFLLFMITPIVNHVSHRLRIPRWLSLILTLLGSVLISGIFGLLISLSISRFISSASSYHDRLLGTVDWLTQQANAMGLGQYLEMERIRQELDPGQLVGLLQSLTGQLMGFLGNSVLIMVFLLFLLVGRPSQSQKSNFFQNIELQISKYIWTKVLASLLTGFLIWLCFLFIGLDLAFTFGVLAFLLNFIPNLGALITSVLPLPVAFLQFGLGPQFVLVLLLPLVVQFIIGNVIETKVMGDSLGLHPVVILLFLIFWGLVWGMPGMFLAVPMTAVLKLIFTQFPQTQVIARWMEGEIR